MTVWWKSVDGGKTMLAMVYVTLLFDLLPLCLNFLTNFCLFLAKNDICKKLDLGRALNIPVRFCE